MAEYLSPGVYVEEFSSGVKPMEGVSTSTAGFIGMACRGPVEGVPKFVGSFGEYQRIFGGYLPESYGSRRYLPMAVEQFFANGGSRCYVVRLLATEGTQCACIKVGPVTFKAANPGVWGNGVTVSCTKSPVEEGLYNLTVTVAGEDYAESYQDVSLDPGNKNFVVRALEKSYLVHAAYSAEAEKTDLAACSAGAEKTDLYGAFLDAWAEAEKSDRARKTRALYRLKESDVKEIKSFIELWKWNEENSKQENEDQTNQDKRAKLEAPEHAALKDMLDKRKKLKDDSGNSDNDAELKKIKELLDPFEVSDVQGTSVQQDDGIAAYVNLSGGLDGAPVAAGAGGESGSAGEQAATEPANPVKAINAAVLGGKDGGPGKRTGLCAFQDVPEISIVAAPGVTIPDEVQRVITHCEIMENRVCILDMPDGINQVTKLQAYRSQFSSSFAAMYHPWIQVFDALQSKPVYMPPSGAMAGIYARTDNTRGVYKAPANEVIRNCTGLQTLFGKPEQDMLNPVGINLIRNIQGLGTRVWGARTLSSDSSWKYINVRRLFIFIEETIRRNTAWAVFEPNDQLLWTKVRGSIVSFLGTLWRDGALFGATEAEAFFVNIGKGRTMTNDDILNGRLICVIGVAPVRPAEFVIFRITQIMEQNG